MQSGAPEARTSNEFYKEVKGLTTALENFVGRHVARFFRQRHSKRTTFCCLGPRQEVPSTGGGIVPVSSEIRCLMLSLSLLLPPYPGGARNGL
jgi:hypothetical protein